MQIGTRYERMRPDASPPVLPRATHGGRLTRLPPTPDLPIDPSACNVLCSRGLGVAGLRMTNVTYDTKKNDVILKTPPAPSLSFTPKLGGG